MNITEMTKEDFAAVPYLDLYKDWKTIAPNNKLEFHSFVIIPVERDGAIDLHDSGWGCMEFCLVGDDMEPIGKVGGGSDVLHLDGIGGYGDDYNRRSYLSRMVPVKGWTIDCLPCGYLNLWTRRVMYLRNKFVGSSCEIYSEADERPRKEEKE